MKALADVFDEARDIDFVFKYKIGIVEALLRFK